MYDQFFEGLKEQCNQEENDQNQVD